MTKEQSMTPDDNRYSTSHEYVHLEPDGDVAIIGITDYAQKELGDVVFVELPQPGTVIDFADEFGTIESVKAVSELFSPVSGEVVEINEALHEKPELVNTDPYGDGWMIKMRLSNAEEVEEMMTAKEYDEYVEKESAH
jgi:glycine cleavage system H protein